MIDRASRFLLMVLCVLFIGIGSVAGILLSMPRTVLADGASATPAQQMLLLNEVMASNQTGIEDPDSPGKHPDWLEVFNPNMVDTSLDGLFLIKGVLDARTVYTIPAGLTVPAQGFILFYVDKDDKQGPQHTNFNLRKSDDSVGLYGDADAQDEIDSIGFQNQVTDVSIGRTQDGGLPWRPFTRATPGRSNLASPPSIQDVVHSPALPTSSQSVTVTAVISDDGPIASASVIYSVAGGSTTIPVPMTLVSDSLFRAVLPPQRDGELVQYYVEAFDLNGERAPDLRVSNFGWRRYPVGYIVPQLVINEVIPDNINLREDPDDPGDYPDLVELYNAGPTAINLKGISITDDLDNPTKFSIADTLSIEPAQFLLLYADEDQEQGDTHTNFKLNKDGEVVALYGAQGSVQIDVIAFEDIPGNMGYGRFPDGAGNTSMLLPCATPGAPNLACDAITFIPIITR